MDSIFDNITSGKARNCETLRRVINRAVRNVDAFPNSANAVVTARSLFEAYNHDYAALELSMAHAIDNLNALYSPAFAKAFEVGLVWALTVASEDKEVTKAATERVVLAYSTCPVKTDAKKVISEAIRVHELLALPPSVSNATTMLRLACLHTSYGMLEREAKRTFNLAA